MSSSDIVPFTCVFLDCCWRDFFRAASKCIALRTDRLRIIREIEALWKNPIDQRPVLPCLSVRTGLDLYLRVMAFPRGSEIIMSAINIPDIVRIVHHHGLRVVSMDITLETMAPKLERLEHLITGKTVAILLAHIYGKWFDMDPFITIAKQYGIPVIEDCAESFCGFTKLGHPEAELSLFSFGSIKYYTAFGGAIAKVQDPKLCKKMADLYSSYPNQKHSAYLYKVIKYSLIYLFLNCPRIVGPTMSTTRNLGIDSKKYVVGLLRGFPDDLMNKIRYQPSTALLAQMLARFHSFCPNEYSMSKTKGDYVVARLPEDVIRVGTQAQVNNYWLFPIVVEDPEEVLKSLNMLGVDAYRGATQLSVVEPDNGDSHLHHLHDFVNRYPHEASFLMDHVIYLPVNKLVPFQELDKICEMVEISVRMCGKNSVFPLKHFRKIQSKL